MREQCLDRRLPSELSEPRSHPRASESTIPTFRNAVVKRQRIAPRSRSVRRHRQLVGSSSRNANNQIYHGIQEDNQAYLVSTRLIFHARYAKRRILRKIVEKYFAFLIVVLYPQQLCNSIYPRYHRLSLPIFIPACDILITDIFKSYGLIFRFV